MIIKTIVFFIYSNVFSGNTPIKVLKMNSVYKNDTFITKTKYYNIKLVQSNDTTADIYTPIYKNRKVIINDSFFIDLDSICSKSNLFNDAFSLYPESIKVVRKNKKALSVSVDLWQSGCSGSFCSDRVQVYINLKDETIRTKVTDLWGR